MSNFADISNFVNLQNGTYEQLHYDFNDAIDQIDKGVDALRQYIKERSADVKAQHKDGKSGQYTAYQTKALAKLNEFVRKMDSAIPELNAMLNGDAID